MLQEEKKCTNCLHKSCMFFGENRPPIYSGVWPSRINCWDNAFEAITEKRKIAGNGANG